MFDTIHCEYPLPVAEHQGLEFQTKNLECLLDTYTITADGRLVRHAQRGEFWGARLDHDVEWPLHGDIRFYTSKDKEWIEYIARFTHGQVEWIRDRLQALAPGLPLNSWFVQIVESGTGKRFKTEDNERWTEVTRPILEAFFHARFFLEMAVRYADLEAPPQSLPSGYAALLYLFGLR